MYLTIVLPLVYKKLTDRLFTSLRGPKGPSHKASEYSTSPSWHTGHHASRLFTTHQCVRQPPSKALMVMIPGTTNQSVNQTAQHTSTTMHQCRTSMVDFVPPGMQNGSCHIGIPHSGPGLASCEPTNFWAAPQGPCIISFSFLFFNFFLSAFMILTSYDCCQDLVRSWGVQHVPV